MKFLKILDLFLILVATGKSFYRWAVLNSAKKDLESAKEDSFNAANTTIIEKEHSDKPGSLSKHEHAGMHTRPKKKRR